MADDSNGRSKIPAELRRQVLVEASHRCAIPQCPHPDVDIHHIIPWARCKKHEFGNLIALCPNCHRRAEKGEIDRKALQKYKALLATNHSDIAGPSPEGLLEIVSIIPDDDAVLDIKMRNLSDDAAVITKIHVDVLKDLWPIAGVLEPSAEYEVSVEYAQEGESSEKTISHVIEPHGADRIKVSLRADRALHIRVTLHYNGRYSIAREVGLFDAFDDYDQ